MKSIRHIKKTLDIPVLGEVEMLWPSGDKHLYKWAHQVAHSDAAIKACKKRRVCVQAGGACGIWPLYLSKFFDTVITFEPFRDNFQALVWNCAEADNIIPINAALGDRNGMGAAHWQQGHEANFGAQFVGDGKDFLLTRLDDFHIQNCDLLIFDLEGFEGKAFRGAERTIKENMPVILYEECGHVKRFGETNEGIASLFSGYNRLSKTRDDVLLVPA